MTTATPFHIRALYASERAFDRLANSSPSGGGAPAGHAKVTTTLTVYAHLINTDDHTGNMAALGALAAPKPTYTANVVPLRR